MTDKEKEQIRKETAKEILDEVSKHYGGAWLVELYKQYGVEVECLDSQICSNANNNNNETSSSYIDYMPPIRNALKMLRRKIKPYFDGWHGKYVFIDTTALMDLLDICSEEVIHTLDGKGKKNKEILNNE